MDPFQGYEIAFSELTGAVYLTIKMYGKTVEKKDITKEFDAIARMRREHQAQNEEAVKSQQEA